MFPIKTVHHCVNEYAMTKSIGQGSFGSVCILKDLVTQTNVAGKFIRVKDRSCEEKIRKEIVIIASLHHENIAEYLSSYSSPEGYIIVTKYYSGKTLSNRRINENFEEQDVIFYIIQICKALNYMHESNVVHLDIKPCNVVCESEDSKHIRIIDFGLSCKLDENITAKCGTRKYLSPEMIRSEQITGATDMWSLGVMTYWLLTLRFPFPNISDVKNFIEGGQYNYNAQLLEVFSDTARNFIENLLIVQPQLRMTASSALQHSWLSLPLNNEPSSKAD